jgi:transposase
MSNAQWVGIDVSKATLDIALRPSQQNIQVPNTAEGIIKLWEQLSVFTIQQVIIEATGGFEQAVALNLHDRGLIVSVINPLESVFNRES